MWRLKPEAAGWSPIPGVPWRAMSDKEYAAVSAAYDARFSPDQAGSLERWFERESEKRAVKLDAQGEPVSVDAA